MREKAIKQPRTRIKHVVSRRKLANDPIDYLKRTQNPFIKSN